MTPIRTQIHLIRVTHTVPVLWVAGKCGAVGDKHGTFVYETSKS